MIEAVVYFHGPETSWSGKISEREIIARRAFPFRWAARAWARAAWGRLDPKRCGWAVLLDGEPLEFVEAVVP